MNLLHCKLSARYIILYMENRAFPFAISAKRKTVFEMGEKERKITNRVSKMGVQALHLCALLSDCEIVQIVVQTPEYGKYSYLCKPK